MKGGVASMVAAAEAVAASRVSGDVLLALVADEEHGSIGTEAVLKHLGGRLPDACVVGSPPVSTSSWRTAATPSSR